MIQVVLPLTMLTGKFVNVKYLMMVDDNICCYFLSVCAWLCTFFVQPLDLHSPPVVLLEKIR